MKQSVQFNTYCMPSLDFSLPVRDRKLSLKRHCAHPGCMRQALMLVNMTTPLCHMHERQVDRG